jgi:TRAP-type transport system periplasmic protein
MQRQNLLGATAASMVLAASMSISTAEATEISLKVGTSWNENFPMAHMLNDFLKPRLEEYSDGRLTLDVHLAGTLCNQKTCVEQVKLGQTDMGEVSIANYGGFSTTFEILTLPYIFRDDDGAKQVLVDFLGEVLDKTAIEVDKLKVVAVVPFLGFRQLQTNVGEVRSPADIKGVKVRVTKSPLDGALLRAWGAVATPVDWSETYDAVQQKVVRGLYVQDPVHVMMKFNEVAPNVTLTGGAWTPMMIFMDWDRYQSLPDWARSAIDRAGRELQDASFDIDRDYAQRLAANVQGQVHYYTPTPEELKQWQLASATAWAVGKQLGLYDPLVARRILEAQDGMDEFISALEQAGAF